MLDEPDEFIDAYHGSPHLFDKFDSSKIGTGEGAQAYSHGLYSAQREGIAREYRDRLTDETAKFKHPEAGDLGFKGTRFHFIDFLENKGFSRSVAGDAADQFSVGLLDGNDLDNFQNFLNKNSAKDLSMTTEEHSALLAGIPEARKFEVERQKGHIYKVKIKTGEQNLLDWDTPLKDQPKPIQDKVSKIYSDNYSPEQRAEDQNLLDQLMTREEQAALPESDLRLELTGAQVHDDLVQHHNRENSKKVTELNKKMSDISKQLNEISTGYRTYRPGFEEQGKKLSKQYDALMDQRSALPKSGQPAAAQNLLDAGIPGVKYDDALSRGKEERTKNYVIYSDELIDIAKRYGIPVATVSTIAKASGVTGLIAAGMTPEDATAGVLSSGAKNLLDAAPERLKQAKEQGFNFDNVMYHASKQDIEEFVPGYDDGLTFLTPSSEFASNWLGKGKFQERQGGTGSIEGVKKEREQFRIEGNEILKSLPESERQKYYEEVLLPQDQQLRRDEQVADSAVYPVVTKTKKPFVPSKDVDVLEELYGKDYLDAPFGSGFATFRDAMRDGNYLLYENKQVVDFLKSKGYDSMFLKESSGKDAPFTTFAVFEPEDIRSVNAQFDPKKTDSKNLLASPVPVTMGAGLLSAQAIPTVKDKAVAVGETLLDAGQAMIAPMAAAPHALIPALTSNMPTAQIEQNYQNLLQQQNYEPSTQLGQEYSQQAQQFMGDAFNAAAQSAPGQAIEQFVEPINLLMQQAPDRARLIGRSLLDMSPF